MYEMFSDRARQALQIANQVAQRFNHEYVGTEHLLLGLCEQNTGVAAILLKELDVDPRKVRLEIEKIVQPGPDAVIIGKLPQTLRTKKVIEYAIETAREMGHNYIGTEHVLLGILKEKEGVAAQVLINLGLSLDDVKTKLMELLNSAHDKPQPDRYSILVEKIRKVCDLQPPQEAWRQITKIVGSET